MLGEGKRLEAIMIVVCAALGVIAIVLVGIGINTQAGEVKEALAEIGKAVKQAKVAPVPTATPVLQEMRAPVADVAEPAAPHGPVPKNGEAWIGSDDYPIAALDKGLQGAVAIVLKIDASGRVTDCIVAQSSDVAILDDTTCRLGRARARFYAARDPGGQPVASTWQKRVVWRLPD